MRDEPVELVEPAELAELECELAVLVLTRRTASIRAWITLQNETKTKKKSKKREM